VLPVFKEGKILGVLDVDSSELAQFDEVDQLYLEKILAMIP
jgi:GAF domain-containing protein